MKTPDIKIDASKAFQMLYVSDNGPCDDGPSAYCPHCGSGGRYVYTWAEFGITKSAMAGCFKALTGQIKKSDEDKFFEILSQKQATNKPLNSWQKTVVRMMQFIEEGKYSIEWCQSNIYNAISSQKQFATKKWGGR